MPVQTHGIVPENVGEFTIVSREWLEDMNKEDANKIAKTLQDKTKFVVSSDERRYCIKVERIA